MNVRPLLMLLFLLAVSCSRVEQTEEVVPGNSADQAQAVETMKAMRAAMFSAGAAEFGFEADPGFPHLYGVAQEFMVGEFAATVIALQDGSASLYTTGGFGIIGGKGHESVREAAVKFVKVAEEHYERGTPTTSFPFPVDLEVNFYFLTYDGPTLCTVEKPAIQSPEEPLHSLYVAGHELLTQLQSVHDASMREASAEVSE